MQSLWSGRGVSSKRGVAGILFVLTSALLVGLVSSCGGNTKTSYTPVDAMPGTVQVNFGDAPADWILAFSLRISAMEMNRADGQTVNLMNREMSMEMTRLMATVQPVALVSVPQARYQGAKITISSVDVSYVKPETNTVIHQTMAGPFTASISFPEAVNVATTPYVFNFDLDLSKSLSLDGGGEMRFTPVFHTSTALQLSVQSNNPAAGGAYQMAGVVASVSSDSFTMEPIQAAHNFRFMVNANTRYSGNVQNREMLKEGMGVLVCANLQADGTMLATRIYSRMNAGGMMGGGIITEVTGVPATALTIVMQNGAGASLNPDYLSKTLTVNLKEETSFEIDTDRISLELLPFEPIFDASHIYAGQSVLPVSQSTGMKVSGSGGPSGSITAEYVRLQEQGFRGVTDVQIVPSATAEFVLTLPAECAFTTLTGAKEITVYQLPFSNVYQNTTITAGSTLRIHGLLFQDSGKWVFVASTIAPA